MPSTRVVVNCRTLGSGVTGVQRYLAELLPRLGAFVDTVAPANSWQGIKGHVWEQLRLPMLLHGRLLFSPANAGPVAVCRQVLTIHDLAVLDHPEWFSTQYAGWYRWMLPRLVCRVRRVITVSNFSRDRILETCDVPADRVVAIHNGVAERFQPRRESARPDAAQLGIPTSRYILALSSIEPRKNVLRLLAAWRIAQANLPDDLWLVVAGGPGSCRVFDQRELAHRVPPRTHFTGQVPDHALPALYSSALAFGYVSLYEGFGLPPLEAMASDVPVVTSNTTSLPEVVGDAAVLVNPTDVEEIADGMKRIASDESLRASLRQKGLERARKFSWDETARRTREVLQTALY